MIKQTAGRDQLGKLAPNFAHYNDDILFGENWNDTSIDLKTRCIITVVSLMSMGITDNSLMYHLENAKKNGISKEEMVGIVTHVADARTCVLHPASHTHRQLTDEQLIEAGVRPDLIRYSVGIEDVEDIINDLETGFKAL